MNFGLTDQEVRLIGEVVGRYPAVTGVILFGSRAKGTAGPASDIDLALLGTVSPLQAEAVAAELDELPMPYRFDVKPFEAILSEPLREHIRRVGIRLCDAPGTGTGVPAATT